MGKYSVWLVTVILVVCTGLVPPSYAQAMGEVRVVFVKAALIAGAGVGRGTLTYRGHDYPFRVSGLSLGLTAGASVMRLTGHVDGLREVKDFAGTCDAAGGGGAFIGGVGGAQLTTSTAL
jgi:hypothetical protein